MPQQRKIRAAMTETCDANSLGDIADVVNTLVDESDLGRQLVIADMDLSEIAQNKSGWRLEDHRRSDIAYPII